MPSKKISELLLGNLTRETIIPIVTNIGTEKTTIAAIKDAVAPHFTTGDGVNSIINTNSNNMSLGESSIVIGTDSSAGYRGYNASILGNVVTLSDNVDYTSTFSNNKILTGEGIYDINNKYFTAPDFIIELNSVLPNGVSFVETIPYVPISLQGLNLMTNFTTSDGNSVTYAEGSDFDDFAFSIGLPEGFTFIYNNISYTRIYISTNGLLSLVNSDNIGNCCFTTIDDVILAMSDGFYVSVEVGDARMRKLYTGLIDGGQKFVVRFEGTYYRTRTDISEQNLIYSFVFDINHPNRLDLVIEQNDIQNISLPGLSLVEGVVTAEFSCDTQTTIRHDIDFRPTPIVVNNSINLFDLSAPILGGENIFVLGNKIKGLLTNTTYVDKLNIKTTKKEDTKLLLGLDSNGNVVSTGSSPVKSGDGQFSTLVIGTNSIATGQYSHSEGSQTIASGFAAHAEGLQTTASGNYSHAEGYLSRTIGQFSHAEGYQTTASSDYSHAEGVGTTAAGNGSHSEGQSTIAGGQFSHAGGQNSSANGQTSFIHGNNSQANNTNTIVFGANIIGNNANTTYVDNFNIKTLGTGTSVKSLGLDTDGNVVTVSANTVSTGWSLLGNSVTSTDFIGTTNNQDIRFKRENVNIGRVALSSVFFGSNSGLQVTGNHNVGIGNNTLSVATTMSYNLAIGNNSLANTVGSSSIAIGSGALPSATSGTNLAVGGDAGAEVTTGTGNLILGINSGRGLTTGINNVFVGTNASPFRNDSSGNVVLGNLNPQIGTGQTNTVYIGNGVGDIRISSNTSGKVSITKNLNVGIVNVYADNASAIAGLLVVGDVYRTSTGIMMIVF
jgi:hypothetical protein